MKTQIWIAISVYVLVAIVKKELHLDLRLYTILQILSIIVLEKDYILQVIKFSDYKETNDRPYNQLSLCEL